MYNPICQGTLDETQKFCLSNWCFVDKEICKKNSTERVESSSFFNSEANLFYPDSGKVDLFYSYTTCNSSSADWADFLANGKANSVLRGVPIVSTASYVVTPMAYKTGADGAVLTSDDSPEYLNDTHPFKGVYIDYMEELIGVSNNDIVVNYTHRSKSADAMHPQSAGTAAIQDVADGLLDMAVGPYW